MFKLLRALIEDLILSLLFVLFLVNGSYSLPFYDGGYDDTGFIPNRSYIRFTPVEFLNPYSGNLIIINTDISLPGRSGMDLEITRIYNSKQVFSPVFGNWIHYDGAFGMGWDFFFARVIPYGQNYLPEAGIQMSDGSVYQLYKNNHENIKSYVNYEYIAENFSVANYNEINDIWEMILKDGTVYRFDHKVNLLEALSGSVYYPSSIEDTNGNIIEIEYYDCCEITSPETGGKLGSCPESRNGLTNVPYIRQITDTTGRIIKFNWINNSCRSANKANVISSIELENNEYRYFYIPISERGSNRVKSYMLKEVQPPEGPGWRYDYEWDDNLPNGEIKKIQYPSGGTVKYVFKTLNYTRKDHESPFRTRIPLLTRVLRSRSIAGPDIPRGKWEFDYGFAKGFNTTRIRKPCGADEVLYFYTTLENSYIGNWAISLLYKKERLNYSDDVLEVERHVWSPYKINTNENILERGYFYPLLINSTINRDGLKYKTDFEYERFYPSPTKIIENSGITDRLSRITTIDYYQKINKDKYLIDKPRSVLVKIGNESKHIVNEYDPATGNLILNNKYGVKTEYSYYPDGNLKWIKNSNGVFTHYSNYIYGLPELIKYGSNSENAIDYMYSEKRSVNWDGTIASNTNGRGYTTKYRYDGLNRLTKIMPPENGESATHINYDNTEGRYFTIQKGNSSVTYRYDGFGRLVETLSNAGIREERRYDQCGKLIYASVPFENSGQNSGNSFFYDSLGRPVKVLHPDGTSRKYIYQGNTVTIENERSVKTVYNYESFGSPDDKRLTSIIEPNSSVTSYEYDIFGNISKVKQPKGKTRHYIYNSKNFLVSSETPEAGKQIYKYDDIGNIILKKTASGQTIYYSYDDLGRLVFIDHPSNEGDVYYSYDKGNNIKSVSSSSGDYEYLYEYDPSNRLLKKEVRLNNGSVFYDVEYSYDANSNLKDIRYPSGETTRYLYDNANRLTGIVNEAGDYYLGNVIYHPSGAPIHYETSYGVISDFSYDNMNRMKRLKVSRPYPELRIIKQGAGNGRVKSVNILGIDCGYDCNQVYPNSSTTVILDVDVDEDSEFVGWTGDPECKSVNPRMSVVVNDNRSCIAKFSLINGQKNLRVKKAGEGFGTVLSKPDGIVCGRDCEEEYDFNTEVGLSAIAGPESYFESWTGDEDCKNGHVVLDKDLICIANFNKLEKYILAVTKTGSGTGLVTTEPEAIVCGRKCEEAYIKGSTVSLTAEADSDSEFVKWDGDDDCKDGKVTMNSNKSCIAVFERVRPIRTSLKIIKVGNGSGEIISIPEGINCGSRCYSKFERGSSVRLKVYPDSGSVFNGWSGRADCTDGIVSLDSHTACIARFAREDTSLPPLIEAEYLPEPNENGWYDKNIIDLSGPVEVIFSCTDRSGSGISSCTLPVRVSEEGITDVKGIAVDNDGNKSELEAVVRIDKTSPQFEITNYDDNDIAKLTEVVPLSDSVARATIRGNQGDNLSGVSHMSCYSHHRDVHRIPNENGLEKISDNAPTLNNMAEITGSQFECDVNLYSVLRAGVNSVYLLLYDKAGNRSDHVIDLAYYGYYDTTPPSIEDFSLNSNYCYDPVKDKVSATISLSLKVIDDKLGPDFDSDGVELQGFPIDMDFECTDNGIDTSICNGHGDTDADNIYRTSGLFRIYNRREVQGEYMIEDLNGNVATEPISFELPHAEQLRDCP